MKLSLNHVGACLALHPVDPSIDPGNVVSRMVEPLAPDTIGSIVDGRELLQELLAYSIVEAFADEPEDERPTVPRIAL